MVRTVSFQPDWALPPGRTVSAILEKKKLSLASFDSCLETLSLTKVWRVRLSGLWTLGKILAVS